MQEKERKSGGGAGRSLRPALLASVPPFARDVCRALAGAGETGYVVGGSLRDLLRGAEPLDWDVATTATPQAVMRLFRRTVPTGVRHGTVTVLAGGRSLEVTTLRGEGAYSDGRRPDEVVFLRDIVEDLARRDFTVNAMALDPLEGVFFDPFGGERDLGLRTIRAVGDARQRFGEDGLRVLRAARFAATLEFGIEEATRAAMAEAAGRLGGVSAERKRDELRKLLLAREPSRGLRVMAEAGLLPFVLPALAPGAPAARVDGVAPALPLRLAALLCDLSPGEADAACAALKLDGATRAAVVAACSASLLDPGAGYAPADVRRMLRRFGVGPVRDRAAIARADLLARSLPTDALDRLAAEVDAQLAAGAPLSVGDLAVKGGDLIAALGIPPGPAIGRILDALLEHVLERPEDNEREKLIEIAERSASHQ